MCRQSILVHSGSTTHNLPLIGGHCHVSFVKLCLSLAFRPNMTIGHRIMHLLLPMRGAVAVVESLEVATLLRSSIRGRHQSVTQIRHIDSIAVAPKCLQ